jgi:DNA repair protein SbcD/Mre11
MSGSLRVLLLSDTHVGLDLALRPRVQRRRRGDDFLRNFERAVEPALRGQVDLVLHGGDLFNRSAPPEEVVRLGWAPLLAVARAGVPVVVVPGNHERSRLPRGLLDHHPLLHVFDGPGAWCRELAGLDVEVVGLPFARRFHGPGLRRTLSALDRPSRADVRLLLMHQAVEGAQVGVHDFTFRPGGETLAARDVPGGFAAVLSGHIHRRQALRRDRAGRALAAPVIYPGSVERTAFAERLETKGYGRIDLESGEQGGRLAALRFVDLPTRPMTVIHLPTDLSAPRLRERIAGELAVLDPDAVVQLRPDGPLPPAAREVLAATSLRELAPETMNVAVVDPARRPRWKQKRTVA